MTIKDNTIELYNGEVIEFDNHIQTVLEFPNCFVVLLLDETLPKNNISAYNYDGKMLWNISDIIQLDKAEVYTYIWEGNDKRFITGTSDGMRFTVDVMEEKVITESID